MNCILDKKKLKSIVWVSCTSLFHHYIMLLLDQMKYIKTYWFTHNTIFLVHTLLLEPLFSLNKDEHDDNYEILLDMYPSSNYTNVISYFVYKILRSWSPTKLLGA